MKTIQLKYTLPDEQILTIAKGLGYMEIENKPNENGVWVETVNSITPEEHIANYFHQQISSQVKGIFLSFDENAERELMFQKLQTKSTEIQDIINNSHEIIIQ